MSTGPRLPSPTAQEDVEEASAAKVEAAVEDINFTLLFSQKKKTFCIHTNMLLSDGMQV